MKAEELNKILEIIDKKIEAWKKPQEIGDMLKEQFEHIRDDDFKDLRRTEEKVVSELEDLRKKIKEEGEDES